MRTASEELWRNRVPAALQVDPGKLLSGWLVYLSTGARGYYCAAGASTKASAEALECINEVVLVLAKQLKSLAASKRAYPDDALIVALREKATHGECGGMLEVSADDALSDLGF